MAKRKAAGEGAGAAARERARGPSLARVGGADESATTQRMPGAQSRWSAGKDLSWEPLRRRARVRGQVRPPAGRPLPPRGRLPPVAARQAAERLPLRSARGHAALRAREPGVLVGVQRLLIGPQIGRHVLQVDPDAGPGRVPARAWRPPARPPAPGAPPPPGGAPSSARARRAHPPCAARARSRSADASASGAGTAARAGARPRCFR